jgi:hypothetical protein
LSTASKFVETATKCFGISKIVADCKNQFFNVSAFVIVSCVVKVFDTITNNVVSGFNFFITSETWSPSTFDTKCVVN